MDVNSAQSQDHGTLTTQEEIHCHKARIFSVLTKAPVVRAWKDAICDGAIYLGKGPFPTSYADRYFKVRSEDISYVTFSIVTAFEEIVLDAEGQGIERFQCHISPAQREASEFLIVTFSNDHNRISLLPRRLYWQVEGDDSIGNEKALPNDEISASTLSAYSYSINLLLANIDEIKRITVNPMHPTTTPFQIGLDGRIPRAGCPRAIMPQMLEPPFRDSTQERALRSIHREIPRSHPMMVDFLEYQPLLRDFKIVFSSCERFPAGLEVVISHNVGRLEMHENDDQNIHLRYADYLLTHAIMLKPDYAFFVPRRLIRENWFTTPNPEGAMPTKLLDSVDNKEFIFEMDATGKWTRHIWRIISKYPPGEHPTPAEEKQEMWKRAIPWPEVEGEVALQIARTPQKARGGNEPRSPTHDSGTGADSVVKPTDVSLLAAHYMEKASLNDDNTEENNTHGSDD